MTEALGVVAPGPAGSDRRGAIGRRLWRSGVPVLVTSVVLLGAVRVHQIRDRAALGWQDTADFLESSQASWLSLELWAGRRPLGAAALLKVVGGDFDAYLVWQATFAVLAWSLLAASVATAVAGRRARWGAALVVLALSTTAPVTMWERSVLSESLAISALALVVAAGVQLARGVDTARVVVLLAAFTVWSVIRDTHVSVVLIAGAVASVVVVGSWLVALRRDAAAPSDGDAGHDGSDAPAPPDPTPAWLRPVTVLAAGALVLGGLVGWASSHGERHTFPISNVYEVRVLPYPDRVAWFADHGMPQPEVFTGPAARTPHQEPGMPPVMYVGDDDAVLGPWLDWVATEGRPAFARYVLSHPAYLVTEPLRTPERAFNNARGDRSFYAPQDLPRVPLVDRALALPSTVVLLVGVLLAAWAYVRRRATPVLVVGAVTALLAVPHGLTAWHSDGMETARHLVVPALQLHLGVLLMVVGTVWGARRRGDDRGRGSPAAWGGERRGRSEGSEPVTWVGSAHGH